MGAQLVHRPGVEVAALDVRHRAPPLRAATSEDNRPALASALGAGAGPGRSSSLSNRTRSPAISSGGIKVIGPRNCRCLNSSRSSATVDSIVLLMWAMAVTSG